MNQVGTGSENTAVGYQAFFKNSGTYNTAIGSNSMYSNTTGEYNTAIGHFALESNTSGVKNTALGSYALELNSGGTYNTAAGYDALSTNSTGTNNTAMGYQALRANTTSTYNSAFGSQVLFKNSTGSGISAFGYQALYNNTTQLQNTAFGNESLYNSTSNGNTALGFLAGHDFDNGDYNTFLGIYADANAAGYQNSTAIGSSTDVTASNQVRIGTGVVSIGGPQNWTNTSDGRIKTNVRSDVPGLAFVNLLHPVTYNKSIALEEQIIGKHAVQDLSPDNGYEKIRYSGFIAQEVEAAADSIGYDFSGVDAPQNETSLYGLRYAEFVVPLVKAVQELSQEIEKLKEENMELRKLLENK